MKRACISLAVAILAGCVGGGSGGGGGYYAGGGSDVSAGSDAAVTSGDGASSGGDTSNNATKNDAKATASDGGSNTNPPAGVAGGFFASIDGGKFTVDYNGALGTGTAQHKQTSGADQTACATDLVLSIAKPDGTCKLEYTYGLGFGAQGLQLKSLKFWAKTGVFQDGTLIAVNPCAGWTNEPSKGEVIYSAVNPSGSIDFGPLPMPAGGQAQATLGNQTLQPKFNGPTTMKFQGRSFSAEFSFIGFAGTVVSTGNPGAACGVATQPLPAWQLKDITPGSAGFNKTYGLEAFAGKKVVVALVSDWCNSCRAQTQLMQQLQDKAVSTGHPDVQMVLIADKQKSDPSQLTKLVKNVPIFQDVAGVDAWKIMNASHTEKFKTFGSEIRNSGYGYGKDGAEIMYFAPNGTGSLNLTAFQQAVQTVIDAADPAP